MRAIDGDAIISQCEEYSNLLKYDGTTDREWAVVKRIILIIKEQPTIELRKKGSGLITDVMTGITLQIATSADTHCSGLMMTSLNTAVSAVLI